MLKQSIDLPGVGNARELGGYAIGEKRVRSGVLLRTAALAQATPEAIQRLHDTYRVQYVVDFRMSAEQSSTPDPQVPGAQSLHLSVVETDDFMAPDGTDPELLALLTNPNADRMKLFEVAYECGMLGPQTYVEFLLGERGKAAYASFFRALLELEAERAILWHCTDGKDRTGCAAMLLLCALGASRQTVLEDYLLTNEHNAAVVEAVRQRVAGYPMPQDKLDALLFMSGAVIEEYMTHALDTLERSYGSVVGYLEDELGVGATELDLLRDAFLV